MPFDRPCRVAPLAALLILLTASVRAQSTVQVPASSSAESVVTHDAEGHVVIRATRITEPMRIDGRMDEEIYQRVPAIAEFFQQVPKSGAPVTERTEFWVLFDDRNIYITCRFWDEHPERIVANDMRRDSTYLSQNDRCDVALDPLSDHRTGYLFSVTPLGGMRDGANTDETMNFDWNGVWDARTVLDEHGWIAEIAIPFKTLRYQPVRQQTWGIQLRRIMRGKNEFAYLTTVPASWGPNGVNHLSVAPTLVGIETPASARNIDIKPYAISRLTTDLVSTPNLRNDVKPDAGLDVRYGVTKSLTASLSVNTDFAEAEADDVQVNLTRFSLVFPEKREFFLEGQGLFQFGGNQTVGGGGGNGGLANVNTTAVAPNIFYSRRIGLNGARVVPVLGGARLAGRAGAWTIGALNMESDSEARSGAAMTNFTVMRLRHDVLRRSSVGGILTRRSVSAAGPGANDVFGLDANFGFYQDLNLIGYVAHSRNEGRRGGHDLSYRALLNYTADRYGLLLDRNVIEQNFNPEIGFMPRTNFRRNWAVGRFSPRTRNNPLVRKYTAQGELDYITDNDNQLSTRLQTGTFQAEFHNGDIAAVQAVRDYEFLAVPFQISTAVRLPIGGYSFHNTLLAYTAGQQRRINGTTTVELGSFYDGDKRTISFKGRASVTSRLSTEPNISLNWIDLAEGSFTTTVIGANTVFSMTPQRFVSALVQYNSAASSLSANIRFRWEYQPGSELFVVYTEGRSTFPQPGIQLQNRGLVVKFNHLFRL